MMILASSLRKRPPKGRPGRLCAASCGAMAASRQTAVLVIILPTLLQSAHAGWQAARLTALDCPAGETWCQLLLVSTSACSIYIHPRASPGLVTPLNFGSSWSHYGPCCVLLALLAHPALLSGLVAIWISCPGPEACISACQACLPPDNPPRLISHPGRHLGLLLSDPPDCQTRRHLEEGFISKQRTTLSAP